MTSRFLFHVNGPVIGHRLHIQHGAMSVALRPPGNAVSFREPCSLREKVVAPFSEEIVEGDVPGVRALPSDGRQSGDRMQMPGSLTAGVSASHGIRAGLSQALGACRRHSGSRPLLTGRTDADPSAWGGFLRLRIVH